MEGIQYKWKAYFHTISESKSLVITSLSENPTHEPELFNVLQRKVTQCVETKAETDFEEKPLKIIRTEIVQSPSLIASRQLVTYVILKLFIFTVDFLSSLNVLNKCLQFMDIKADIAIRNLFLKDRSVKSHLFCVSKIKDNSNKRT